jgi:hypothetical protein
VLPVADDSADITGQTTFVHGELALDAGSREPRPSK